MQAPHQDPSLVAKALRHIYGPNLAPRLTRLGTTASFALDSPTGQALWIRSAPVDQTPALAAEITASSLTPHTIPPVLKSPVRADLVSLAVFKRVTISVPPTIQDLGTTLARFHSTANRTKNLQRRIRPLPWIAMTKYRLSQAPPALTEQERTELLRISHSALASLEADPGPLGLGLVHGDAHIENIVTHLDSTREPTPLLCDLEVTGYGSLIADIAPTITAVTRYQKDPHNLEQFLSAYGAVINLPADILDLPSTKNARCAYEVLVCSWAWAAASAGMPCAAEARARTDSILYNKANTWSLL